MRVPRLVLGHFSEGTLILKYIYIFFIKIYIYLIYYFSGDTLILKANEGAPFGVGRLLERGFRLHLPLN